MSNATFDHALFDAPLTSERPLGVSMLASTLLHVALIALLASARPTISLLPAWQAMTASIQVELQQPAVTVPVAAAGAGHRDQRARACTNTGARTAEGVDRQGAGTDKRPAERRATQPVSIRTGPPNPNGSVAVGLLANPEKVSTAIAARLAQTFPVRAARAPKLNGAVITGYPIDAARAHQSARIAAVLTVDSSGQILDRDIVLSPDDPVFRAAVLTALASTKFTPAELDGKPITHWAILEFVFDIDPPGARQTAAQR